MLLQSFRGNFNCNPGRARHVHPVHELLAVVSGRGRQLVGDDVVACKSHDVFIFPAGCRHMSHSVADESFTAVVLNIHASHLRDGVAQDGGAAVLDQVASALPGGGKLPVRPAVGERTVTLLRRAEEEARSGAVGSLCAARALVMESLVVLARDLGGVRQASADAAAAERHLDLAERWLADYWMTPVAIADLVALGPLGRSQFLARFRARTGRTVGERLLELRLGEAQRRMLAGGGTLLDVALACGFGSQSHFNHRFRQATGRSPGAWLAAHATS